MIFSLISFNPDKMGEISRKEKTSFQVWDEEKVKHFINVSQTSRLHTAYLSAISSIQKPRHINAFCALFLKGDTITKLVSPFIQHKY